MDKHNSVQRAAEAAAREYWLAPIDSKATGTGQTRLVNIIARHFAGFERSPVDSREPDAEADRKQLIEMLCAKGGRWVNSSEFDHLRIASEQACKTNWRCIDNFGFIWVPDSREKVLRHIDGARRMIQMDDSNRGGSWQKETALRGLGYATAELFGHAMPEPASVSTPRDVASQPDVVLNGPSPLPEIIVTVDDGRRFVYVPRDGAPRDVAVPAADAQKMADEADRLEDAASEALGRLCRNPQGFTMSIPPRDSDIDITIAAALTHMRRIAAALRASSPTPEPAFDFVAHLRRQREWSGRTFGPARRSLGVVDHIRKELREIEANPDDLSEWIDVVILALDGAWRHGAQPEEIIAALQAKQAKNEARTWPDWCTMPENGAIEHDRSGEATPEPTAEPSADGVRWDSLADAVDREADIMIAASGEEHAPYSQAVMVLRSAAAYIRKTLPDPLRPATPEAQTREPHVYIQTLALECAVCGGSFSDPAHQTTFGEAPTAAPSPTPNPQEVRSTVEVAAVPEPSGAVKREATKLYEAICAATSRWEAINVLAERLALLDTPVQEPDGYALQHRLWREEGGAWQSGGYMYHTLADAEHDKAAEEEMETRTADFRVVPVYFGTPTQENAPV